MRSSMLEHRNTHSDLEPYPCTICYKCFGSEASLEEHQEKHTVKDRPYPCNICDRSFNRKFYLLKHLEFHENGKLPTCDLCNKTFESESAVRTHRQFVHVKDKTYTCKKCQKTFTWRSSLITHSRRLHGEDPFH